MRNEAERAESAVVAIMAIFLVLGSLCVWGCAPGLQATTYATALNGALYPEPAPIAYQPFTPSYMPVGAPWRSQYMVPRVSCVYQGNTQVCRPI